MKPRTYAQVVAVLRKHGFEYVRSSGSHRLFHMPGRVLIVTVPYHGRNSMITNVSRSGFLTLTALHEEV